MPYRQPVYHCQPVYHSEDSLDPQKVHALHALLAQHGQGVVVPPPHIYGQSQGVTPPPPPPPPHDTPSSSTGPVCAPGWAAPSAVPAPSPNVEHSQHGSAPSPPIHLAEKQLQEQSLKEQFVASQKRKEYSDAQMQEWHALSREAQVKWQEREYAAFCLMEANRRKTEANNF